MMKQGSSEEGKPRWSWTSTTASILIFTATIIWFIKDTSIESFISAIGSILVILTYIGLQKRRHQKYLDQAVSIILLVLAFPSLFYLGSMSTSPPRTPTPTRVQESISTITIEDELITEYKLRLVYSLSNGRYYIESSEFDGVGILTDSQYLGVFRYIGKDFKTYYGIQEGKLSIDGDHGILRTTRSSTNIYSFNSFEKHLVISIEDVYYIDGHPGNPVTLKRIRDDIYSTENPQWKGVGFFDGKTYWGIYKYTTNSERFKNVLGTHEGVLSEEGYFQIHGVNLKDMTGSFDGIWKKDHY